MTINFSVVSSLPHDAYRTIHRQGQLKTSRVILSAAAKAQQKQGFFGRKKLVQLVLPMASNTTQKETLKKYQRIRARRLTYEDGTYLLDITLNSTLKLFINNTPNKEALQAILGKKPVNEANLPNLYTTLQSLKISKPKTRLDEGINHYLSVAQSVIENIVDRNLKTPRKSKSVAG